MATRRATLPCVPGRGWTVNGASTRWERSSLTRTPPAYRYVSTSRPANPYVNLIIYPIYTQSDQCVYTPRVDLGGHNQGSGDTYKILGSRSSFFSGSIVSL